ncbi:hypothetical protein D3C72_1917280 [compost metagenome]
MEVEGLGGIGAPQPQCVHGVDAVAQDRRVEGYAGHGLGRHPAHAVVAVVVGVVLGVAAQAHLHRPFGALDLPRVAVAQPGIGLLHLHAIHDGLLEDAVFVADAIAERGDFQRRQRIHEAGREPAQAAISQPRLDLLLQDAV